MALTKQAQSELKAKSTTGHKYISFHTVHKKYSVRVPHEGNLIHLGYYSKLEDAIIARNAGVMFTTALMKLDFGDTLPE